jgi:hypothetical protein
MTSNSAVELDRHLFTINDQFPPFSFHADKTRQISGKMSVLDRKVVKSSNPLELVANDSTFPDYRGFPPLSVQGEQLQANINRWKMRKMRIALPDTLPPIFYVFPLFSLGFPPFSTPLRKVLNGGKY